MQRFDEEQETGVLEGSSVVQSISRPHTLPPVLSSSDIPLYLNIERPTHYDQPDLCVGNRCLRPWQRGKEGLGRP